MKLHKFISIIVTISVILTTFWAWYLVPLPAQAVEIQGNMPTTFRVNWDNDDIPCKSM